MYILDIFRERVFPLFFLHKIREIDFKIKESFAGNFIATTYIKRSRTSITVCLILFLQKKRAKK